MKIINHIKAAAFISAALFTLNASAGAVGVMPQPNPNPIKPIECTPDINEWGNPTVCTCPTDANYNPKTGECEEFFAKFEGDAPYNGSCSDPTSRIKLVVKNTSGGAHIGISSADMYLNGKIIGEIRRGWTGEGPRPVDKMWELDVNLEPSTKVILEKSETFYEKDITYAIKMTVKDINGLVFDSFVICHDYRDYMRP